jgi:hypothetical protein
MSSASSSSSSGRPYVMTVRAPSNAVEMKWANGQGNTIQLAIHPPSSTLTGNPLTSHLMPPSVDQSVIAK